MHQAKHIEGKASKQYDATAAVFGHVSHAHLQEQKQENLACEKQ